VIPFGPLPGAVQPAASDGYIDVLALEELPPGAQKSVAYGFPKLHLTVDGKAYEAASVVVSKGRLYGGPYMLAPNAAPTRPGFQVALFENPGTFAALLSGAALPLGLLPRCPGVRVVAGALVEFAAGDGPIMTQSDGDALKGTPFMVTNARSPIPIVIG